MGNDPVPADTEELDALASAMNRSAERVQTLWFTFLAVTLYFAISALTTTHRMLLLEEGQTLPIINVKLPLLPFYLIAPAFYVVLHAYMLMMLVLLSRTAKTFEDALNAPGGMTDRDRERYRMRIENAIFLQIIVGASRERSGANGFVMRAIALATLAIAPVLVLLLFQLMFLPYHSEIITWWHRTLIVVDLALVWTLWSSYRREWGERMLPRLRPISTLAVKGAVTLAVVSFSFLLATFPGEVSHRNRLGRAADIGLFGSSNMGWFGLWHQRKGIFPNRLWLPNEDFVDDENLKRLVADNTMGEGSRPAYTVDLAGRNLAGAYLTNADLRQVNAEEANLINADLGGAWLQGSLLLATQLQGANLHGAQLQGASLYGAQLQGADLQRAQLQGADLQSAQLQGADLQEAQMQGSLLREARLQGASFMSAKLQGASLREAQLQGATLAWANLQAASLEQASVWRASSGEWPAFVDLMPLEDLRSAEIGHLRHDARFEVEDPQMQKLDFSTWLEVVLKDVPPQQKELARDRLRVLDPANPSPESPVTHDGPLSQEFWRVAREKQGDVSSYESVVATDLEQVACSAMGAPYVVRGLIRVSGRLTEFRSVLARRIVTRIMAGARTRADQETDCPGGRGLTHSDMAKLDKLLPER
jgi:uncharacterized protein YjbI with pentapeptide repeats